MNRIGNAKDANGIRLQLHQVLTAVIHGSADPAILPAGVFHSRKLIQLSANLLRGPSFLRQSQVLGDARTLLNELIFQIGQRGRDLLVHLLADARGAQQNRIEPETDREIDILEASNHAIAAQRTQGLAGVAQDKQYEN